MFQTIISVILKSSYFLNAVVGPHMADLSEHTYGSVHWALSWLNLYTSSPVHLTLCLQLLGSTVPRSYWLAAVRLVHVLMLASSSFSSDLGFTPLRLYVCPHALISPVVPAVQPVVMSMDPLNTSVIIFIFKVSYEATRRGLSNL